MLRRVAKLAQLAIHLIDGRAEIALEPEDPPAQFGRRRRDLLHAEASLAGMLGADAGRDLGQQNVDETLGLLERPGGAAKPVQQRVRFQHPVEHRVNFRDIGANQPNAVSGGGLGLRGRVRGVGRNQRLKPLPDVAEMMQDRLDLRPARPPRSIRGTATARPRWRAPGRRSPAA